MDRTVQTTWENQQHRKTRQAVLRISGRTEEMGTGNPLTIKLAIRKKKKEEPKHKQNFYHVATKAREFIRGGDPTRNPISWSEPYNYGSKERFIPLDFNFKSHYEARSSRKRLRLFFNRSASRGTGFPYRRLRVRDRPKYSTVSLPSPFKKYAGRYEIYQAMTKAFRGSTTDPEITFTFIIILCKYMQECYIRQATVH